MPISITCTCGKKLNAKDELAGKRVKCPACGSAVLIPEGKKTVPVNVKLKLKQQAASATSITCSCGKKLRVKPELAGKRVKCPACGAPLIIPITKAEILPPAEPAIPFQTAATNESLGFVDAPISPATTEDKPPAEGAPAAVPGKRKRKKGKRRKPPAEASPPSYRDYLYWVLLLTFVPLVSSLLQKDTDDIRDRLERTVENAPAESRKRIEETIKRAEKGEADLDDLIVALPESRIEGAHLPRKTWVHWLYALLSAVAFFGIIVLAFPQGNTNPGRMLAVGAFTATIGILLLLAVQLIAELTQGVWLRGRSFLLIFFYIAKFIGFSYRSAVDPDANFFLSLFGFTFGVGLCEEMCKALPLLVHFRRRPSLNWQAACFWGVASGVGFGVSEGITYSSDFYNGFLPFQIYVVRFVSCVALHAVWTAAAAITLYKYQNLVQDNEWYEFLLGLLIILAVPMVLHGLYDTFLKKDMNALALATALVSFGWLAWQMESARRMGR